MGDSLFGESDYFRSLEKLVIELKIEGQVQFLGHRDDVPDIIARECSVLVHSSTIPEPFGQVVAQGLSTGVPVIASDGGGPAEMIVSGQNGILFPLGDVEALSKSLLFVRSNSAEAAQMAEVAKAQFSDVFTPSGNAVRFERFLSDVKGGKS